MMVKLITQIGFFSFFVLQLYAPIILHYLSYSCIKISYRYNLKSTLVSKLADVAMEIAPKNRYNGILVIMSSF